MRVSIILSAGLIFIETLGMESGLTGSKEAGIHSENKVAISDKIEKAFSDRLNMLGGAALAELHSLNIKRKEQSKSGKCQSIWPNFLDYLREGSELIYKTENPDLIKYAGDVNYLISYISCFQTKNGRLQKDNARLIEENKKLANDNKKLNQHNSKKITELSENNEVLNQYIKYIVFEYQKKIKELDEEKRLNEKLEIEKETLFKDCKELALQNEKNQSTINGLKKRIKNQKKSITKLLKKLKQESL